MTHTATLVHITPNAEELISYMARVSNPANQSNTETSAKLIRYLIKHKHFSPFEMVNMCVEIIQQGLLQLRSLGTVALPFKSSLNGMQKLQQLALCPNYGDRIIQIDRTVLMI